MSTDNNNLEDMVEKSLESAGILSKIRAELRANVFHVLEKGSSFQNTTYMDKIKDFVSNKNGLLLLSLVKDLFEHLELTFTTSVFEPETGAGHQYKCIDRNDISEELSLSKGISSLEFSPSFQVYFEVFVTAPFDGRKSLTIITQNVSLYRFVHKLVHSIDLI